jgi:hypothetical protein
MAMVQLKFLIKSDVLTIFFYKQKKNLAKKKMVFFSKKHVY